MIDKMEKRPEINSNDELTFNEIPAYLDFLRDDEKVEKSKVPEYFDFLREGDPDDDYLREMIEKKVVFIYFLLNLLLLGSTTGCKKL